MSIEHYYYNYFQEELNKLSFQKPNLVILENADSFGVDKTTQFFGGSEWEHCATNLQVSKHKSYFVLSLFAMVCNDLNMHANFKAHYPKFRSLTNFPKFGWSGLVPHFESPEWLINKPLSMGLVSFDETMLKDFTALWKATAQQFFSNQMPEISSAIFFEKLCAESFFTKSEILAKIKNYINEPM